jgi:diaminohydroxyphosphoribosylaminopyrimidine deaminase / 5-amino-6-(5-phosphoribosylamino)uracil reductase
MFTAHDHQYMALALQQAERGLNSTSPNPRVGCVIVNQHSVVGQGAHLIAGEPHAEIYALKEAGALTKGATAYVTLEPCSHFGKTPPCAEALIKAGVKKVVAAMVDPNPLVSGKGMALLQSQGIETASGLMETQARQINQGFIKRMEQKLPFVRCKIAASLDGKTALSNGQSQWITSPAARADVQHWRARACAIITGVGTVLADNPSLTVRDFFQARQPLRVIIDSQLNTPLSAKVLQHGNAVIAYVNDSLNRVDNLKKTGVKLLQVPANNGRVCLKTMLLELANLQINEVLVEAGATLSGALVEAQLVDELLLYYAPKLMGHTARSMVDLPAFTHMNQVFNLNVMDIRMVGSDIRLQAIPQYTKV